MNKDRAHRMVKGENPSRHVVQKESPAPRNCHRKYKTRLQKNNPRRISKEGGDARGGAFLEDSPLCLK